MSGRDDLGRRVDDALDREAGRLAARPLGTLLRWAGLVTAAVVALVLFFGALGWLVGWFGAGRDVASPANVRAQYAEVIGDWQAMEAAAGNYCQARAAKADQNSPTLLEDPAFAYAASYRRIAVDYNRRQANIFESRLVGPKGYPREAPRLAAMRARVC